MRSTSRAGAADIAPVHMLRRSITTLTALLSCLAVAPAALAAGRAAHDDPAADGAGSVFLSSAVYQANENAGQFAVTVERTGDLSQPETFYYGVTNKSSEAGNNFDKIPNTEAQFAPGQSIVHVQRDDPRSGDQRPDAHSRAPTSMAPIRSRWARPARRPSTCFRTIR